MPYGESPNKMGHSPAEMGHSPMKNQNKGYAKQERKDLMQDMPIVKDAMGGRSWMSKHSKSAFQMGHSPAEMGHDSPAKKEGEKPKTKEELATESRLKGMKALAKKARKEGRHTGTMVTVMTSTGPQQVDSRSQAARDLPRAN